MNWQSKNSKGEMMVRFEGVLKMLERRMKETTSESMKKYYMQFISDAICTRCNGQKLRPEFLAVKFEGKSIFEITDLSVRDAHEFFKKLKLTGSKKIIADEVIKEILSRLSFLLHVGLHYLSLDRKAPTLSGVESQRIRLASQIGRTCRCDVYS
jgi:excinuclease ABC subunit A